MIVDHLRLQMALQDATDRWLRVTKEQQGLVADMHKAEKAVWKCQETLTSALKRKDNLARDLLAVAAWGEDE